MTDPNETAVEAVSDKTPIEISSTTGTIIICLATYGAVSVVNDARSLLTKIRRNRKAKKEVKVEVVSDPAEQQ